MMMKGLMAFVIVLLVPAAVMAKGACWDDKQKFCSDAAAKEDVKACLKKHADELSDGCKAKMGGKGKKKGDDAAKDG